MSARDELALILVNAQRARYDLPPRTTTEHCSESCWAEADAILAAGYRKPRIITTVDEARQLRVDAVLFSDCTAYQNYGDDAWAGAGRFYDVSQISLPAVVLHEP